MSTETVQPTQPRNVTAKLAKKGDFVVYRTQLGHLMRSLVKERHKNGHLTVQPFFEQVGGKDVGMCAGGLLKVAPRFVVSPDDPELQPASVAA